MTDRAIRSEEYFLLLPAGWSVSHKAQLDGMHPEVFFTVKDDVGDYVTDTSVYYSRRDDWWHVRPGSSTDRVDYDEARGRAVAFLMAADEAEDRNKTIGQ